MKQSFETYCPLFPGFYNTLFEYDNEDYDIENYNEENGTDLKFDDFTFDYSDYRNRISKCFVNRLETELNTFLPIKIEFQELYSPREYNFSNDSINVKIELDLNILIKLIKERSEDAEKYFLDKYSPCSGFIPFHSKHLSDWLKPSYIMANPAHRIGALLDCLCNIEIAQDDIYYWCDGENYIDYSVNELQS